MRSRAAAAPPPGRAAPSWAAPVAFLLRVVGLSYGLPDFYHSGHAQAAALRVVPFMRGNLLPSDTYPVLHMYLVALLMRVRPHRSARVGAGPSWPQAAVTARLLNATLGPPPSAALRRRAPAVRLACRPAGGGAAGVLDPRDGARPLRDGRRAADVLRRRRPARRQPGALVGGRPGGVPGDGRAGGSGGRRQVLRRGGDGTARGRSLGAVGQAGAGRVATRRAWVSGVLAAFILSTPLLLLEPGRWIHQIQTSNELFLAPPPPPLTRLWLGSRVVLGLALLWFGLPLCLGCARRDRRAGAARLARRARAGDAPIVFGIYVWFRPHGLDDRYLVILAPFVVIAAALAVAGLARWSRRGAIRAGMALIGIAALDAAQAPTSSGSRTPGCWHSGGANATCRPASRWPVLPRAISGPWRRRSSLPTRRPMIDITSGTRRSSYRGRSGPWPRWSGTASCCAGSSSSPVASWRRRSATTTSSPCECPTHSRRPTPWPRTRRSSSWIPMRCRTGPPSSSPSALRAPGHWSRAPRCPA